MEDSFLLPITYKGEELELETTLKPYGYTYRFEVNVSSMFVQFESDEEGSYRALVNADDMEINRGKLSFELLQVIAHQLAALHER